jgi:hypothetical protein
VLDRKIIYTSFLLTIENITRIPHRQIAFPMLFLPLIFPIKILYLSIKHTKQKQKKLKHLKVACDALLRDFETWKLS